MSIKNLFGRGIGFGGPEWIPTKGYSIGPESLTTYAIIGPFTDKRPRFTVSDKRPALSFTDKRPRFAVSQPKADE